MAVTLRLPAELDAELRAAAEEDHRSVQQAVVHAIETYLALRETVQIKSDPGRDSRRLQRQRPACRWDPDYGARRPGL